MTKLQIAYPKSKFQKDLTTYENDKKTIFENTRQIINSENSDWTNFEVLNLKEPEFYMKFAKPQKKKYFTYEFNKSKGYFKDDDEEIYIDDLCWYYKGWNENLWKIINIFNDYWLGSYRKEVKTLEERKNNAMIRKDYELYFKKKLIEIKRRHDLNEKNIAKLEKRTQMTMLCNANFN